MDTVYNKPYFDPDFESLIERIHPPSVSIDNDTWPDCTLVKVDSANKHGILLEMVQVLTDLDLVISKSYICSDGGWFMDVFHVTDQFGRKVTDESLLLYIQQAMCASRRASQEVKACAGREVRPIHVSADHTALEITGLDRPGLMSEISAVLAELECHVAAAAAWTHNGRVACIIYVDDPDLDHAADARALLENVVEAHHPDGERFSVRVAAPAADRAHTERRLHQLMWADGDYNRCGGGRRDETHVTIDHCKERGYSVVNVRSRDRPKLLFDTVCTLTDMEYVVFHAAVSSRGSIAFQEYYIRHMDGCTLDSASERSRVAQCLIAATERRVSHGLRLDVLTRNQLGLLSDITRVFREHGLSITRAEIGIRGERAVGSFYVTDASGQDANPETVEMVRQEIGATVLMVNNPPSHSPQGLSQRTSRKNSEDDNKVQEEGPRFSLGAMLWSHLERLSGNFRPIRS